MKKYRNCQSCGMPIKKDPNKGGSNADGSKSKMYCSYCYEKGVFTQPDFTVDQMKQFCTQKIMEQGIPSFFASMMVSRLQKLQRWKNKTIN
ncbi:zinc ribbon domain-containing protein [Flagellimonas sp.]|uniref:zinc ribbon domain-containing protein n=1 Tax=Flagellimonas sp. TaxID=2058762 RepID=UPI003B5A0821